MKYKFDQEKEYNIALEKLPNVKDFNKKTFTVCVADSKGEMYHHHFTFEKIRDNYVKYIWKLIDYEKRKIFLSK
jgi:hypothetical protein